MSGSREDTERSGVGAINDAPSDVPMVAHWYGKPIDTLPPGELIEIINYLAKQLEEYRRPENTRAVALGRVEMWKRGEQ